MGVVSRIGHRSGHVLGEPCRRVHRTPCHHGLRRLGSPRPDRRRPAGFDPEARLSPRDSQRLSLSSQMAVVAAEEALGQARLLDDDERRGAGVILGASMTSVAASEPYHRKYYETSKVSAVGIPKCMNNAAASAVSIRFGLHGQMFTLDAACASSTHAIGIAFLLIQSGIQSIVVTGGSDATLNPVLLEGWSALRVLSECNDDPEHACKPFSRDRDGFVLGEGAGVLVLESETSARARGGADPRPGPRLRLQQRRPSPDRTQRGRAGRGHGTRAGERRPLARGDRSHQRPRDGDAPQRPHRDQRRQEAVREPGPARSPSSASRAPSGICSAPRARWRPSRAPSRRCTTASRPLGTTVSRIRSAIWTTFPEWPAPWPCGPCSRTRSPSGAAMRASWSGRPRDNLLQPRRGEPR